MRRWGLLLLIYGSWRANCCPEHCDSIVCPLFRSFYWIPQRVHLTIAMFILCWSWTLTYLHDTSSYCRHAIIAMFADTLNGYRMTVAGARLNSLKTFSYLFDKMPISASYDPSYYAWSAIASNTDGTIAMMHSYTDLSCSAISTDSVLSSIVIKPEPGHLLWIFLSFSLSSFLLISSTKGPQKIPIIVIYVLIIPTSHYFQ